MNLEDLNNNNSLNAYRMCTDPRPGFNIQEFEQQITARISSYKEGVAEPMMIKHKGFWKKKVNKLVYNPEKVTNPDSNALVKPKDVCFDPSFIT
jgi:hypothetical protein